MKKYKIILASTFFIFLCFLFIRSYLINYHGAMLYFLGVSVEHSGGYREAQSYNNLPTEKLLEILDNNKDASKFPPSHFNRYLMGGRYVGAVTVLGSKTDQRALDKLSEIINTYPDSRTKWAAIGSIGKSKNKAMVPVICEALKRHTDNNTDRIIVEALVAINDSSARDCLIQEKDKIKWKDCRAITEKAIEKWSK